MIHERHSAARGDQQLDEVVTCAGICIGLCAQIVGVRWLQTTLEQRLFNRVQPGALSVREPGKRIMRGQRDAFPSAHHVAFFDEEPLCVVDQDQRDRSDQRLTDASLGKP